MSKVSAEEVLMKNDELCQKYGVTKWLFERPDEFDDFKFHLPDLNWVKEWQAWHHQSCDNHQSLFIRTYRQSEWIYPPNPSNPTGLLGARHRIHCGACGMKSGDTAMEVDLETWTMPFGKHAGLKVEQIPKSYKQWFIDANKSGNNKKIVEIFSKSIF